MFANLGNCWGILIGGCILLSSTAECGLLGSAESFEDETGDAAGTLEIDAEASQAWGGLVGRFALVDEPQVVVESKTDVGQSGTDRKQALRDESLVIDQKTRGIKNIIVFARKVSQVRESHKRSVTHAVELEQRDCRYRPHVLTMRVGQLLTIRNDDSTFHVGLVRPPLGVEGRREVNSLLSPGDQTSFRFIRQESKPLPVQCGLHRGMRAYVLPRNDSYFAVTDKSGSFEIIDLPAGEEIEFQVWHEKAGGAPGGLIARPAWTKGRFRVTIPAGSVKDLGTIEVPSSAFSPPPLQDR